MFFQCRRNTDGDILVDGGVADNYPIQLFDTGKFMNASDNVQVYNPHTLGFRLDTKAEITSDKKWTNFPVEISNLTQYIEAIITYMMETANKKHLRECDKDRTIFIDSSDIKTTDFNISREKINILVDNGKKAVHSYF